MHNIPGFNLLHFSFFCLFYPSDVGDCCLDGFIRTRQSVLTLRHFVLTPESEGDPARSSKDCDSEESPYSVHTHTHFI